MLTESVISFTSLDIICVYVTPSKQNWNTSNAIHSKLANWVNFIIFKEMKFYLKKKALNWVLSETKKDTTEFVPQNLMGFIKSHIKLKI